MDKDNKYGIRELPKVEKVVKQEEKYWGYMSTLFDQDGYSIKKIFMRAGTQSSMEYHVHKKESYYIEKGQLKLGLRIGRGENKSIILNDGDVVHIPVGLMHMRMAIEDTIIIEVSTTDDDNDSHIVEDGKTYKFVEK
jgi:mannose-6-phosphate isomerase-like protein (cupin superfamily)|tara:strand:- start:954 stop:1364 length:411 start_codon:yes stop_codon:yes gene_type:complete